MKMILVSAAILTLLISSSFAQEQEKRINLQEAIDISNLPDSLSLHEVIMNTTLQKNSHRGGFYHWGNRSGWDLQTFIRLVNLGIYQEEIGYEFKKADAPAWKAQCNDKKASIYARLCAAYFLLDEDKEARQFVEDQIESENLRYRYNAVKIAEMYMNRDPSKTWAIDLLINQLEKGTLERSVVESSHEGGFPEGDRNDIMHTPIDDICWDLGFMKEKKAVPVLIDLLKRRPEIEGAIFALGEIGDPKAIPILLNRLKEDEGRRTRIITALGRLKCKEAIPIFSSMLPIAYEGPSYGSANAILEAFLEIGDKSAIKPIEEYLTGNHLNRSKAVARRILVQLKDEDPVKSLLALLENETDEDEIISLIYDLHRYKDHRSIEKLTDIAAHSKSAWFRDCAINALGLIGNREALMSLVNLFKTDFPKDLESGGIFDKFRPDFSEYFPESLANTLKESTGQDFRSDSDKWKKWIEENVKE
jgi:HEAT repeat protein